MADKDLQQLPPVATTWTPIPEQPPIAITPTINIPDYAQVRRNALTGVVEISDITMADLVSLRDALTNQIIKLEQGDGWEPL